MRGNTTNVSTRCYTVSNKLTHKSSLLVVQMKPHTEAISAREATAVFKRDLTSSSNLALKRCNIED